MKPVCPTACARQQEKPLQWEACTVQRRLAPVCPKYRQAHAAVMPQHSQIQINKCFLKKGWTLASDYHKDTPTGFPKSYYFLRHFFQNGDRLTCEADYKEQDGSRQSWEPVELGSFLPWAEASLAPAESEGAFRWSAAVREEAQGYSKRWCPEVPWRKWQHIQHCPGAWPTKAPGKNNDPVKPECKHSGENWGNTVRQSDPAGTQPHSSAHLQPCKEVPGEDELWFSAYTPINILRHLKSWDTLIQKEVQMKESEKFSLYSGCSRLRDLHAEAAVKSLSHVQLFCDPHGL